MRTTRYFELPCEPPLALPYTDLEQPGDQPTALYERGWGCSYTDIDGVAERLAQEPDNLRIIGVGQPDRRPTTINSRAQVLSLLAEHLQLGPHAVIGHSLGGADAAQYARRSPLVTGLASVMGNHHAEDNFWTGQVAATHEKEFVAGPGFDRYLQFLASYNSPTVDTYARRIAEFGIEQRRAYHAAAVDCVEQIKGAASLETFLGFTGVKYFIHGDAEQAVFLSRLRHPSSNTRVVTIPGAGHFPHMTHEPEYAQTLAEFIRESAWNPKTPA